MVRASPMCAICEFVMKQLESMLEDQTTEVGYVLLNLAIMAIKIYNMLSTVCWCSKFDSVVKLIHLSLFQEEVIQAVEKVCTYLPSTLSGQCKDLIETYGQAIIELLVQQADPKTVCTVLALCNDARRAYVCKFSLF